MFLTRYYPVAILNIIGNKYFIITYPTNNQKIFLPSSSRSSLKYRNNGSKNKKKKLLIRPRSSWLKLSTYDNNTANSKNIRPRWPVVA
jgi:hypothetical protein